MVVDVHIADNAASTHVPELSTWHDDRDFCGELSPPRQLHIYTTWPHKYEDLQEQCQRTRRVCRTGRKLPHIAIQCTRTDDSRLYVRNLNDKLPKEDLKRNLYMLFATYGAILDIVALKTMKMRGQAHVVFRDIDSSTQAMRALQGFTFFGKDMVRGDPSFHAFFLEIIRQLTEHSKSRMQRLSPTQ